MTQQERAKATKGYHAFWCILLVTFSLAIYVLVSNALFHEQPILDTLVTVLAVCVVAVFAFGSFEGKKYQAMRLRDSLKDWTLRVGKYLPFVLAIYGAISLVSGHEPTWWYITTTCVGALGALAVGFWWWLKDIAKRGL